jgi:hypothetical protein
MTDEEFKAAFEACWGNGRIKVGDYYEDCSYDLNVAVHVSYEEGVIDGISLFSNARQTPFVEGAAGVGSCSIRHCGITKIKKDKIVDYIKLCADERCREYYGSKFENIKALANRIP